MLSYRKFLVIITLAATASAQFINGAVVPPASQGISNPVENTLNLTGTDTDSDTIVQTALNIDQKVAVPPDATPDLPVPPTTVTAVDGTITDDATSSDGSSRRSFTPRGGSRPNLSKRDIDGRQYDLVFAGTGTGPDDRDGSIEGTAYLTFTLIDNSTYNIDACLDFCSSVDTCVFANLYYELNNFGLDHGPGAFSNLKCAVYADVHTATEKTNLGQQQSYPAPAPLIFIQNSSGFAANQLAEPPTPPGYELVFGPVDGANNAPGYMGFAFLDRYDTVACAEQCNTRGADANGGACQYFNIWRAVVNGVPTTYTCSMYFVVADVSTAVNTGQGDLKVTFSRGYKRTNFLPDGGFEGFQACDDFCFVSSYANWIGTSAPGGTLDATIFHFAPFARTGTGSGLLGSASGIDALPGKLTPALPIQTVAGSQYTITLFQASVFSGVVLEAPAFFQVLWNGKVIETVRPGFQQWAFYAFTVTAQGNDVFALAGGDAPAWSFFDDISIFQL